MIGRLIENCQMVLAGDVVDINGAAGLTGDYVSMVNFNRCCTVVFAGDGTAGSDLDIHFFQATNNTGGGAKVLNALVTGRIFTKQAATYALLAAVGQWTRQTQVTADERWEPADSGENVLLWAFEIEADDLDRGGGFDFIRCDLTDPGAAKIGSALYILYEARYPMRGDRMVSALA